MVRGSRVGGPLPVFLLVLFLFSVLFFFPSERISCPFLFFALLTCPSFFFSLSLMRLLCSTVEKIVRKSAVGKILLKLLLPFFIYIYIYIYIICGFTSILDPILVFDHIIERITCIKYYIQLIISSIQCTSDHEKGHLVRSVG